MSIGEKSTGRGYAKNKVGIRGILTQSAIVLQTKHR